MKRSTRRLGVRVVLLFLLGSAAAAQSNQVAGMDVSLSKMTRITAMGRSGVFPNGVNGVAFDTTVCNQGTVEVSWSAPMNPRHPKIAFLVASVRNGRIEQISDRSFLKHGFYAANAPGCGFDCDTPGGNYLGLGCSDTYAVSNNGDSYFLGPADEVNPWLGTWTRTCSYFDRGDPEVDAAERCDSKRSLTYTMVNAMGPVANRIHLRDEDLVLGGTLCFQGQYVIEGLPEPARADGLASRTFTASWTGAKWELAVGAALLPGTVLQRWPGAEISSNTNGGDDGRLYVALVVTGPVDGFFHYEYAVHNRDNNRGVGALRVPLCPGARVRGLGFRDLDQDPANDWSASVGVDAVSFSGSAALRWNTITNFWFDSDALPEAAELALDQARPGPGLATVAVTSRAPIGLYNAYLGPGCAIDTPPTLVASGSPARATLGNASFALRSAGNVAFQPCALRYSLVPGTFTVRGCGVHLGGSLADVGAVVTVAADANGLSVFPLPIPADLALEGLVVNLQAVGRDPGHGPLFTHFELSDGLAVRVGDALAACP